MNDQDGIAARIQAFLVRTMGLDPGITGSDPLFSSGQLDSIDLVEILEFIEAQWGVSFSAFDVGLEDMDSVDRIVSQLRARGI